MLTVSNILTVRDILMVSYILAVDILGTVKDLEKMVTVGGSRSMNLTFDRKWVPRHCSSELEHKSLILVRVLYTFLSRLDLVKV
jgi:hypothetical protein